MSIELQRGEKRKLHDLGVGSSLTVTLDAGLPGADVSVFGLDDDRQLRDDRYFVFYNQPGSPAGEIITTALPSSAHGTFSVDLARLPQGISRLMFVATHDDRSFNQAGTGRWTLAGAVGSAAQYTFDGRAFAGEKAVMVAEIYRHGGEWRLSAVGQGFNGGLQALLESFGGEAEEGPAAPPVPPAPVAPAAAVPPADEPAITPGKPVSLRKQQTVSLEKAAGSALTQVMFGLGWDPATRGGRVDLDAGCLVFDEARKCVDKIWFMRLSGVRGAVRHSGDNLTGHGGGDDECITVDLTKLPASVRWLVFTVNSFSGQRFTQVGNAYCRAVDVISGRELARYCLTGGADATGMLMAKIERRPDGWHMTALGEPGGGMTVRALVKPAERLL